MIKSLNIVFIANAVLLTSYIWSLALQYFGIDAEATFITLSVSVGVVSTFFFIYEEFNNI